MPLVLSQEVVSLVLSNGQKEVNLVLRNGQKETIVWDSDRHPGSIWSSGLTWLTTTSTC